MQHKVGDDVEGQREMLVEHFRVEADQLLGGERVQIAADRIDGARDILGGTPRRPLEQHVLDEVGEPVLLPDFTPRT